MSLKKNSLTPSNSFRHRAEIKKAKGGTGNIQEKMWPVAADTGQGDDDTQVRLPSQEVTVQNTLDPPVCGGRKPALVWLSL